MDELNEELNNDQFRVAIFGSARLKADSPEYYQVFNLARLIASAEIHLVTGGGHKASQGTALRNTSRY